MTEVNSRERVIAALNHQEPDRVPFDMGATVVSGIHHQAYQNLREYLGLERKEVIFDHYYQQLAKVDQDVIDLLRVDVRGASAHRPAFATPKLLLSEDRRHFRYIDEFGIGWQMPRKGGLYFDIYHHPLQGDLTNSQIDRYPLPDPADPARFRGLRKSVRKVIEEERRAVTVGNMSSGIFELLFYLRGFEDAYLDWAGNQPRTQRLLGRFLELQFSYWDHVFEQLAGLPIDVVELSDDLAGQARLLISPASYRKHLKPLHKELVDFIHGRTNAKIFFHSCGSIREIIPDLIEIGVDILNPVQVNALNMESAGLKREFGSDLVFWGGGVDTQSAFDGRCSPADVRSDVKRRLDDLMPGGGFIFNPVHNIQGNVPPENIMAMWETLQEYGVY